MDLWFLRCVILQLLLILLDDLKQRGADVGVIDTDARWVGLGGLRVESEETDQASGWEEALPCYTLLPLGVRGKVLATL